MSERPSVDRNGRTVVSLDAAPSLGRLYARGVAKPVLKRVPGRTPRGVTVFGPGASSTLPAVTYRLAALDTCSSDVRGRLAVYDRLIDEPMTDALPAGFVHVLAFPVATALMVRDDFPLPLAGLVHLTNAVQVRRPILAGDTLEVRSWADGLRPHARGTQVDLVTEVRADPDDDVPSWRGVSTYLAKGIDLPGSSERAGSSDARASSARWAAPLPTERWALDAATGRRYAAVSGDRNPIHLSALSAKAFGFPRAIAHGMYTASRALASVARERGDSYDWSVSFAKPVLLPGIVDVAVRRQDDGSWTLDGWSSRTGARHFGGGVVPR